MKYKIQDLLEKVIDNRGKTPPVSETGHILLEINSLVGSQEFPDYSVVKKKVSDDVYNSWFRSGHPMKNDILIPTVGTLDAIAVMDRDDCCIAQNIIAFRINKQICDPGFLYYTLCDKNTRKRLLGLDIGGVQPSIKVPHLKQLEVEIPGLHTQRRISKILSSIDEKITLNSRINDNLCQLCKQVFYGKILNYIGEKTIFTFDDLVDTINGYSYSGTELSESSKVGMATIKNFKRSGGFKADGFKSIKPSNVKKNNYVDVGDLLIACTDLTQNADIIGNTIMIFSNGGYAELIASMDLLKIIPKTKKYSKDFLYELFNTAIFKNYAVGCTSGTTVLHLNKKALRKFQIALPKDAEYIKIIDDQLASCHRIIGKNVIENERLIKLRDTLLPELLNGKVDVSNIDI